MELIQVLRQRRSIRRYKDDPVPPGTLKKLLEAAHLAPSWKNQQCWRFIVVTDPEKKKNLSKSLVEGNPAAKAVAGAPVVLAVCADPRNSGNIDQKEYYLVDCALAMHQLMLAACAEGLGTCWVAWFDEETARRVLNVPPEYKIVALSPLGFPEKEGKAPPKKELSEVVYQDQWGENVELMLSTTF